MFVSVFSRRTLARVRVIATLLVGTTVMAACGDDDDDLTGPGSGVPRGASIFGVDDQNRLIDFGRQNPTTEAARTVPITGLQAGETVLGIDFRSNAVDPLDRRLFAVTSGSRLYRIDVTSGAATVVAAAPFTPAMGGASIGFDFNPTVDRIRTHGNDDQNLRLHPVTGATAAVDAVLAYATGDANAGQNPTIVATAYSNSVAGATATDLFAIDSERDVLVFLAAPNDGRLTTRGALGVNSTEAVGFDIIGAGILPSPGTAYATLTRSGDSRSRLYTINLASGAATLIGDVNYERPLIGIAVAP